MTVETNKSDVAHALPRDYYVSEDIYQQELEKVFARQWLSVGHVSLARNPGDYFVKQVGPESMIIARDETGKLHAFFNVCRHRGYRILADEEQGTRKNFPCPYHKWTYATDGCLMVAPGAQDGEDFSFADYSLHEARCDVWYGWIFVYLGEDEPVPLAEVLGPLSNEESLRAIGSEQLKLAYRETYVMECNWKAVLENALECYHCGNAHPALAAICDFQQYYDGGSLFAERDQHFPLHEGMETFSMDGKRVVAKPLGTAQDDGFTTGFIVLPLFCGPVLFVDHAVELEITPLDVGRAQMISEWYVHEDAVEGVDYDVNKLIEIFHITNREDLALAKRNYQGIESARFTPGPLNSKRERTIIDVHKMYLDMMAAD